MSRHNPQGRIHPVILSACRRFVCLLFVCMALIHEKNDGLNNKVLFVQSFSTTTTTTTTTTASQRSKNINRARRSLLTSASSSSSSSSGTALLARRPFLGRRSDSSSPTSSGNDDDDDFKDSSSSSSSSSSIVDTAGFRLDPTSPEAEEILFDKLGLSQYQQKLLIEYANCIVEWNSKINLVSRKDCCLDVVFGRHILPCLAPVPLLRQQIQEQIENDDKDKPTTITIVDVGTGGGFPGIPLAIALLRENEEIDDDDGDDDETNDNNNTPNIQFVLMDSIRKKCMAVEDMVEQLGFSKDIVQVVNTRAEDYFCLEQQPQGNNDKSKKNFPSNFDWCIGRSVTSIQQYATWVQHLMKRDSGKLLYIQGGNDECPHANLAQTQLSVHEVLWGNDDNDNNDNTLVSDKNILIYDQPTILSMAAPMPKKKTNDSNNKNKKKKKNKVQRKVKVRGAWEKKNDPSVPKQRGYENFKRWDSTTSSSSS